MLVLNPLEEDPEPRIQMQEVYLGDDSKETLVGELGVVRKGRKPQKGHGLGCVNRNAVMWAAQDYPTDCRGSQSRVDWVWALTL